MMTKKCLTKSYKRFGANINKLGPISDISALRLKTCFICMAYVVVLTGWVKVMVTCCKSHV